MAENFQNTVDSLFRGMENFITSRTVVGEPIHVGGAILVPLIDVSFGMAASAKNEDKKNNGGGGMGGKMSPTAILVIQNGTTRMINIKNQDGVSKLMDMVPDLVNRFMPGSDDPMKNADVKKAVDEVSSKEEKF